MKRTTSSTLTVLAALACLAVSARAFAQQGPFDLPDDHFLCYKGKTVKGDLVLPSGLSVTLTDQFESDKLYEVRKPLGICNPADKNDEGIVDPFTHLTPYSVRPASGQAAHAPQKNVRVFNQFGNVFVDTIREDRVLLPANKSASGGPVSAPDAGAHNVDHYKCYRVKVSPGTPKPPKGLEAAVEDQFESPAKTYAIKKPKLLCNPVDKNGEGIKNPDGHLLCYQAKPAKGQAKHERRTGVSTADQFVIHKIDTQKEELLCVPSLKNPPAEFCGDGVVNQPPFETCDGDASVCAPGESCTSSCECSAALGLRTFSFDPVTSAFRSGFTGPVSVATPAGTLVLDGGAFDLDGNAPVSLASPPYYITVDINLGSPLTACYELLSCSGTAYCAGGTNVDTLETLDSLSGDELGCIRDGSFSCPDDPSSLCCSNSCEGTGVGGGNLPIATLGVGVSDSGAGAVEMTCNVRVIQDTPFGSDCSAQDYSASPVETHALTTGIATANVLQHCASTVVSPSATPAFAQTGVNFDCGNWTLENGPGTLVWSFPTEEPTPFVPGDSNAAFILAD